MFFNQHLKQKAKVTMEYIFPEHNVSNKWPIRHKKHSTRSTSSTLELFSNQVETAQSSYNLHFHHWAPGWLCNRADGRAAAEELSLLSQQCCTDCSSLILCGEQVCVIIITRAVLIPRHANVSQPHPGQKASERAACREQSKRSAIIRLGSHENICSRRWKIYALWDAHMVCAHWLANH